MSRRNTSAQLTRPVSSSLRPPAQPAPTQSRDLWGEYCASIHSNRNLPNKDEIYRAIFRQRGYSEKRVEEALAYLRQRGNALMAAGGPVVLGAKPKDGDAGVHYYTIPDSNLSIRIWSGGLATFGQYCLDFYDRGKEEAVNTPAGYRMTPIPRPGVLTFPGPLKSWEAAAGCPGPFQPGAEKYSILEGTYLMLQRPGHEDFCFAIPQRDIVGGPAVAMPDGYHSRTSTFI